MLKTEIRTHYCYSIEILESVCLHRKTRNESIQMMRLHMGISVHHFFKNVFMSSPILYKSIFVTTRKKLLHNKQKVNTSQTLFKDSILAPEKTLFSGHSSLVRGTLQRPHTMPLVGDIGCVSLILGFGGCGSGFKPSTG